MTTKLIVHLNDMNKVYLLEKYGRITMVDDFINVVFIEVHSTRRQQLETLPFVKSVEVSGVGRLLTV